MWLIGLLLRRPDLRQFARYTWHRSLVRFVARGAAQPRSCLHTLLIDICPPSSAHPPSVIYTNILQVPLVLTLLCCDNNSTLCVKQSITMKEKGIVHHYLG